jgi:glucans biosynthesis protein
MFLYDATNRTRFDDFRPAVHDSNGLAIALANGERVWRPLANPMELQVSGFVAESPVGFGLIQRGREFEAYEDGEARYELRPSLWIEPSSEWGHGHVELVEIPSDEEVYDNVVAFWQPDAPLAAGTAYEVAYRMYWGDGARLERESGRVLDTRIGAVDLDGDRRRFVIDFDGVPPAADAEIVVSTSAGEIANAVSHEIEATGNYRAFFEFDPGGADLAELRVMVMADGEAWSETWLYRWTR